MQIQVRSIAHVQHLAARLAQALQDVGHEVDIDHVRAQMPFILGYASWFDLGEHLDPNGPLTRKIAWKDRNARQNAVRQRIGDVFQTSRLEALIIVADLAGVAENGDRRHVRVPSPDPDIALHRTAQYLSHPHYMVRTSVRGDKHGFIAAPYHPDRNGHKIEIEAITNDCGDAEIVIRGIPDHGDISQTINWLYHYAIHRAGIAEDGPIDPLVLSTLRRLDWRTIIRLDGCGTCPDADYHRVRRLPSESALVTFLDHSPMLAHVALQTSPSCDATGTADAVHKHVRDRAAKEWPDEIVSDKRIQAAIGAWSGTGISDCYDVSDYELAFLSYCPPERLPREPEQLNGMVAFYSAYGDTFTPVGNMTPSQFYTEFSGDWVRLLRIVEGLEKYLPGYEPITNYIDITRLIIATALIQSGRPSSGYEIIDHFDRLHETLMHRIFAGHSFESMLARYADYDLLETVQVTEPRGHGTPAINPETVREQYVALLASELLPTDLRLGNPSDIIGKLGFSIEKIYRDVDAYYNRARNMND